MSVGERRSGATEEDLGPFREELIAARSGDRDALGRLFEGYRAYLLIIANRELDDDVRTKFGASDVVQDTLCEAHGKFDHFRGESESDLRAWLRRALLNNLRDGTRLFARSSKRSVAVEVPIEGGITEALVDSQLTPMTSLEAREDVVRLEAAMRSLCDDHRQVIDLRYRQDLAFAEIGRRMERSEDAARMLLFRAVERLQQILEGGHASAGRPAQG
jgi:RNA polymerase sigma-70 factor (ECF subfamily)